MVPDTEQTVTLFQTCPWLGQPVQYFIPVISQRKLLRVCMVEKTSNGEYYSHNEVSAKKSRKGKVRLPAS